MALRFLLLPASGAVCGETASAAEMPTNIAADLQSLQQSGLQDGSDQGNRLSKRQHLQEDHPAHHQAPLPLSCFCLSGLAAWPSAAEMPALLLCFAGLAPAGLTMHRFGTCLRWT